MLQDLREPRGAKVEDSRQKTSSWWGSGSRGASHYSLQSLGVAARGR